MDVAFRNPNGLLFVVVVEEEEFLRERDDTRKPPTREIRPPRSGCQPRRRSDLRQSPAGRHTESGSRRISSARGYTQGTRAHLALRRRARFDIVAVDDEKRGEREVGEVGKNGRGNSCTQPGRWRTPGNGGGDNTKSCGNYCDTGVNDTDLSLWDRSRLPKSRSRLFPAFLPLFLGRALLCTSL